MIIKESSILRHLPVINGKQLLILDSIRFTCEMIDHSYNNLFNRISDLSTTSNERQYPALFLNCWSIIDSARRLIRLYKTFPSNSNHSNIDLINYVNSPRNTYQHLDERIDESMIDERQPFYGTLKWVYSNPLTGKAENHIAISGIYYSDKNNFKIGSFDKDNIIADLTLETVDRKCKTEINLSQLKLDLISVINNLEAHLTEQFNSQKLELADWKSKRDILFRLRGE